MRITVTVVACQNNDDSSQRSNFFCRHFCVDHFDGESADLADHLSHFERVARWNGWSHKEKGDSVGLESSWGSATGIGMFD